MSPWSVSVRKACLLLYDLLIHHPFPPVNLRCPRLQTPVGSTDTAVRFPPIFTKFPVPTNTSLCCSILHSPHIHYRHTSLPYHSSSQTLLAHSPHSVQSCQFQLAHPSLFIAECSHLVPIIPIHLFSLPLTFSSPTTHHQTKNTIQTYASPPPKVAPLIAPDPPC